jgi:hypothetical protein
MSSQEPTTGPPSWASWTHYTLSYRSSFRRLPTKSLRQGDYMVLHPRRLNLRLAAVRTWNLTSPNWYLTHPCDLIILTIFGKTYSLWWHSLFMFTKMAIIYDILHTVKLNTSLQFWNTKLSSHSSRLCYGDNGQCYEYYTCIYLFFSCLIRLYQLQALLSKLGNNYV